MQFEYIWLSLMVIARMFYLAVIFAVLWTQGYFWTIVSIAALFLVGNLLFVLPLSSNIARLSHFLASFTDDDEADDETQHHITSDTKQSRRTP